MLIIPPKINCCWGEIILDNNARIGIHDFIVFCNWEEVKIEVSSEPIVNSNARQLLTLSFQMTNIEFTIRGQVYNSTEVVIIPKCSIYSSSQRMIGKNAFLQIDNIIIYSDIGLQIFKSQEVPKPLLTCPYCEMTENSSFETKEGFEHHIKENHTNRN